MDKDVWYEEVDNGFAEFIQKHVDCEYTENTFTPISVYIGNPEQDSDDFHLYPRCVVNSIGEQFSYDRNDNRNGTIVSREGTHAIVKLPTQPFYLTYQISFYAKFKSDIDRITKLWRKTTGRAYSLPVVLADGSTYKCRVDLIGQSQSDMLDREVLRYIRHYTYKVWVDLEGGTYEANVVTNIQSVKK